MKLGRNNQTLAIILLFVVIKLNNDLIKYCHKLTEKMNSYRKQI